MFSTIFRAMTYDPQTGYLQGEHRVLGALTRTQLMGNVPSGEQNIAFLIRIHLGAVGPSRQEAGVGRHWIA
ncbi:hypothetical protein B5K05_33365 [Rhizobium phaseoli]|nr:hypothetical protein B5K05_33365 [Rhizobium phaseoli]RDJ00963.1 hypothetical protein B5K04_31450 [Rhizobium phaseoli]